MLSFSKNLSSVLILVLFVLTAFFLLPNTLFPNINVNTSSPFVPVSASWNKLSSFRPLAFQSNSGQSHLFFIHEELKHDYLGYEYYHTYESENGEWSIPDRIPLYHYGGIEDILAIRSSEKGVIVYVNDWDGLYTLEYDEQANLWLQPKLLFSEDQAREIMNLTEEEEGWWFLNSILGLFVKSESVYLCWENKNSEIIVTKITDSSMTSQTIYGEYDGTSPSWGSEYHFIPRENSLFLYDYYFEYRAELFSNGTWSKWQSTDIFVFTSTMSQPMVIEEQYVIGKNETNVSEVLVMIDLTADNLTAHMRVFGPLELDLTHVYDYDIELRKDTPDETVFSIATFYNEAKDQNTIDLWMLNYTTVNLTKVTSLNQRKIYNESYTRYPSIDLLLDESKERVFWDQHNKDYYEEIFTATYDPVTNEWAPVLQITDADDMGGKPLIRISNYSLPLVLGLVAMTLIRFRKNKQKDC